jgi:hypothetical protein
VSVPDAGKIIIVIGVTVAAPSQSCHPQRATLKWERLPSIHQLAFDTHLGTGKVFGPPFLVKDILPPAVGSLSVLNPSRVSVSSNDSFQNIRRADTAIVAASKEKAK